MCVHPPLMGNIVNSRSHVLLGFGKFARSPQSHTTQLQAVRTRESLGFLLQRERDICVHVMLRDLAAVTPEPGITWHSIWM